MTSVVPSRITWVALRALVAPAISACALSACSGSDPTDPGDGGDRRESTPASDAGGLRPGDGSSGDASDKTPPAPDEPVVCAVSPCVVEIASSCATSVARTGYRSDSVAAFCARLDDGTVRCWGWDAYGALGRGMGDGGPSMGGSWGVDAFAPDTPVPLGGKARRLAEGSCAIDETGALLCWGSNLAGQLGQGSKDDLAHPTPQPVALPGPVARASSSSTGACAVLETGALWCWGPSPLDGTLTKPVEVRALPRAVQSSGSFAVSDQGEIVAWGPGGRETSVVGSSWISPGIQGSLVDVSRVSSAGWGAFCALAGVDLYCLSDFSVYQSPVRDYAPNRSAATPVKLPDVGVARVQQFSLGPPRTRSGPPVRDILCLRLTDGSVLCGGEGYGNYFVRAGVTDYAVAVAACGGAACALLKTGAVECWGSNASGLLGQGSQDSDVHPAPVRVSF